MANYFCTLPLKHMYNNTATNTDMMLNGPQAKVWNLVPL